MHSMTCLKASVLRAKILQHSLRVRLNSSALPDVKPMSLSYIGCR